MNNGTTVTKAMFAAAIGKIVMFIAVMYVPESEQLTDAVEMLILGALLYAVPAEKKLAGMG